MSLCAFDYRNLARDCMKEADFYTDEDNRQLLFDMARLYNQAALQIEVRESASLVRDVRMAARTAPRPLIALHRIESSAESFSSHVHDGSYQTNSVN